MGRAGLIAPSSLLQLAQNADLIVVGAANGDVQAGSAMSFTLQVNRVVKGDPALAGTAIGVVWNSVQGIGVGKLGTVFAAAATAYGFSTIRPVLGS